MSNELNFGDRSAFRLWLSDNSETSQGVWLVFIKGETLSANEALEEALCFGWIDGTIKSIDNNKYIKYFAKRIKKSNWSEKNKKIVLELMAKDMVTPQGLAAIAEAKRNGMWEGNQRNEVTETMIEDFRVQISHSEQALNNYDKMSYSVRKTYVLFYFDAKSEQVKTSRLAKIINRLEQNLRPM